MKTYSKEESQEILKRVAHWHFENDAIIRHFEFKNFLESLAFIQSVGLLADKANHHPEIFNIYNKVQLKLSTHDAAGVTEKDFLLATEINSI